MRDLIIGFVPDEWLHSLDYTTLEKVPGSYISEDFRSRADDVVWRVKVGGELASAKNLVAAVFRIEHPNSPERIGELISLLGVWLKDRPDLRRMFAIWIRVKC